MKYYKKEKVYPNEAFIQSAIEKYFLAEGYKIEKDDQIDLVAEKLNDKWVIEAKGVTSQITVDFNTCIGQLVKSMVSPLIKYAIALPNEIKYKYQSQRLPDYFRVKNDVHIIVVDERAQIQIIYPSDVIETSWVVLSE